MKTVRCYRCGQIGHKARKCPRNNKPCGPRPLRPSKKPRAWGAWANDNPTERAHNNLNRYLEERLRSIDQDITDLKEERCFWEELRWTHIWAPERPSKNRIAHAQPGFGDAYQYHLDFPENEDSDTEEPWTWPVGTHVDENGNIVGTSWDMTGGWDEVRPSSKERDRQAMNEQAETDGYDVDP